ncbi:MAG: formate dehydrogenase subunit gamma [Gammaproteobacteria bacterium]
MNLPEAFANAVEEALASHAGRPGALLPVLHSVQDRIGHIPPEAVPVIAKALNLSRAEVHGVITFYPDFRSAPPPRHVVRICVAEACQAMGADAIVRQARDSLGVAFPGHTAGGEVAIEPAYCFGNCACAPTVEVDGQLTGRTSPEQVDGILQTLRWSK